MISNLPEGVAHKILSLLTFKDLARFGSLSKTCRALYLSTPRLNFILPEHTSTRNEWSRFFSSVDRFLSLRGYNKIIHFRIHWSHRPLFCANPCVCDAVRIRILPWLSNALRCKVEELYIDISKVYFEGTFKFPTSIFLCRSLRTLSVSKGYVTIKTPPLACSSNLQCLKLAHVTLDQGFYKWISSSCQCIQVLHLQNVHGEMDITIESASLKSFSIDTGNSNLRHFQISGEKLEDIHMSLKIFAPNLKILEMIGYPISNQLGRFLHLEKADIWMWPGVDEGDDSSKVFDVLRSIHRVKALTLHYETIMVKKPLFA
ncbi:hypothetical protein C1H46_022650 [Malus baccata]|uniref:F-box domain-containing protein n=1 Tax=Malus baccata TaxID=106549 RepID=A0A540LZE9_MALBA|nr:hypothetical protein C1H46_022650 [Malus baccata]